MLLAISSLFLLLSAAAFHQAQEQQIADGVMKPRTHDTPQQRIVGGTESPLGAFPYQVSVDVRLPGEEYRQVCGGAILAPGKVVTAADCVIFWSLGSDFRVVAGDVDRATEDDTEQRRKVCSVSIHPKYKRRSFDYNFAVLGLCNPFEFNQYVKAIAMTSTEPTSEFCEVSGWGNVRVGNDTIAPTTRLQNVTIPLVERSDCAKYYEELEMDITERILCSGQETKGLCYGDSGATLVCEDGTLVGIGVYTKKPCGTAPGLFANIAAGRRWIDLQEE